MTSPCPNCKRQCSCGCKSCTDRNGINEDTALFDETGELQICPFCKIASCADAWLDAEVEEMKENGTWQINEIFIKE